MKHLRLFIALIILFLLQECSLFWSTNVPGWYMKNYDDSEYIYGKGRGTSQKEELAIKKAKTAAQSELSARVDIELIKIVKQAMQSEGIDKTDLKPKHYQSAKKRTILEIQQITSIGKKEIRHNNSLFSVFILLQLNKTELKELYQHTLGRYKK